MSLSTCSVNVGQIDDVSCKNVYCSHTYRPRPTTQSRQAAK